MATAHRQLSLAPRPSTLDGDEAPKLEARPKPLEGQIFERFGSFEPFGLPTSPPPSRILALVFPHLLSDLIREDELPKKVPQGIVVLDSSSRASDPSPPAHSILDAVNSAARARGIQRGLTLAQAIMLDANIEVHTIRSEHLHSALQRVAEVAHDFGSPVSYELPDTVWVSIGGSSHLFAGERALSRSLCERVRQLGFEAHSAVSNGPWSARAFARFSGTSTTRIILEEEVRSAVGALPIEALPLSLEGIEWIHRLGLTCIRELRRLPQAELLARLAEVTRVSERSAGRRLQLLQKLIRGEEDAFLDAYLREDLPSVRQAWETPISSLEELFPHLRAACVQFGDSLRERGNATFALSLVLHCDASICRSDEVNPRVELTFALSKALNAPEELERVLRARLESQQFPGPVASLEIFAQSVTSAPHWQPPLLLGRDVPLCDPHAVQLLCAELQAQLGHENVGVLSAIPSHLLERSSALCPDCTVLTVHALTPFSLGSPRLAHRTALLPPRALTQPIFVPQPLERGASFEWQGKLCQIQHIQFQQRIEQVDWWNSSPISRDYYRVWIEPVRERSSKYAVHALDLLVFVDTAKRSSPKGFSIQGIYD